MNPTPKRAPALLALSLSLALAACTPRPPIEVGFRASAFDSAGRVLQLENKSDKALSCLMVARNKTLNESTRYAFDMAPQSRVEIGVLEAGWSFKTGEEVEIRVEGHSTKRLSVP